MTKAVPLTGDLGIGGRGLGLVIITIVLTIVSLLFVALRIVSRITMRGSRLGRDDLAIIGSVVFSLAMALVNCIAVDHGYGRRAKTLSPKELRLDLTFFWILQILYKFTINLTKISIGLLYMRIFPDKTFRRRVWAIIAFVGCYATASIVATILECSPVARVWDRSIAGHCINLTAFWYANGSANIATDLILWFMPHRMIRKLNMARQQKIGLMAIFLLGIFVVVMSIVRMTALNPASKTTDTPLRGPIAAVFPRIFSRFSPANSSEWPDSGFKRQRATFPKQEILGRPVGGQKGGRKPPYASSEVTRASTRTFGSQDAIMNFGKDEEEGIISVPLNTISKKTDVDIVFGDRQSMPTVEDHGRAISPAIYPLKALVPR